MKRYARTVAALFAVGVFLTGANAQDPQFSHNAALAPTIKAYELSVEEEASFGNTDHEASTFWGAWDTPEGSSLDQTVLNSVDNYAAGEATSDADDARIRLRLAYGAVGIYLLLTATDDAWSGYTHWLDYANDACDLFGCQVSAQAMYNDPATYLPCINATGWPLQLNTIYFQIQVRFGLEGLEPVEAFSLNKWNPTATDVTVFGCGTNNVLYDRDVTFQEAEAVGILVDILAQTEATVRSQEWLIPWSQWGSTNPPGISQKAQGDRVGLCFGYNDLDPQTQSASTQLRWRRCSPYSNTSSNRPPAFTATPPAAETSLDAWGDIVFDVPLDSVVDPSSIVSVRGARSTIGKLPMRAVDASYFSVDGRALVAPRAGAVLLRRSMTHGGALRASVVAGLAGIGVRP